jgi:hypothetical protein
LHFLAKRLLPSMMMATCFGRVSLSSESVIIQVRPSTTQLLYSQDVCQFQQQTYL